MARPARLSVRLRSLPAAVWWLTAGVFVNRVGSFALVLLPVTLAAAGERGSTVALVGAAGGAGMLASALAGGVLADRIGPRRAMVWSLAASAVTAACLIAAEEPWQLALAALAHGTVSGAYRPAIATVIGMLAPAGARVTAFSAHRVGINAGAAIGGALAGALAGSAFTALLVLEGSTSLVFALVALRVVPPRAAGRHEGRAMERPTDGRFVRLLVAAALCAFVYFQMIGTLPVAARDAGLSSAAIGAVLSLNAIIILLLELPATSLTEGRRQPAVLAVAALLFAAGAAVLLTGSPAGVVIAVAAWSLGEIAFDPVAASYAVALAPRDALSRYQGALATAWATGLLTAPAIGLALYTSSHALPWCVCIAAAVTAAAVLLRTPAPGPRRPAPDPAGAASGTS